MGLTEADEEESYVTIRIRLGNQRVFYDRKTYGWLQFFAEMNGLYRTLMGQCAMMLFYINRPLFMNEVLRDLFLAKQSILETPKGDGGDGDNKPKPKFKSIEMETV